ncbi:MAG TPA: glycosyltransferase family 4 protein, partial [Solirubrobacterales bacterium]|nr:glycosyltransferase family 4 protein [Solirubrobacterales bacterium]
MADQSEPGALTIVQATPHAWGSGSEVDIFVRRAAGELAARGHRVAVIAPSQSRRAMRQAAARVEAAATDHLALFDSEGEVSVLPVGGAPAPVNGRSRRMPVPGEAARLIERALARAEIDILHVHDPFSPSVPSTA